MAGEPIDISSVPVAGPALVPAEQHAGKAPIRLTRPVYVVGSRSTARLQLLSSSVSKAHALVVRSNGRTYIRDLASRTKVFINGREIREAVLDDGDLIKIGKFTFRYIAGPDEDAASAARVPMNAKLDVVGSDYPVPIEQRVVLIGRRSICDVALVEASASTAHAVIFEMDGQRYVRDLGSRTGTFVNGVNTHQHKLAAGDTVRIGETEMRYLPNEVATAEVVEEDLAEQSIPTLLETAETHSPELAVEDLVSAIPMAPAEPPPLPAPAAVDELAELPVDDAPPLPVEAELAPMPVDEAPPLPVEEEVLPPVVEEIASPPPVREVPIPTAPRSMFIDERAPRLTEEPPKVVKASPPVIEEPAPTAPEPFSPAAAAFAAELPALEEPAQPIEPEALSLSDVFKTLAPAPESAPPPLPFDEAPVDIEELAEAAETLSLDVSEPEVVAEAPEVEEALPLDLSPTEETASTVEATDVVLDFSEPEAEDSHGALEAEVPLEEPLAEVPEETLELELFVAIEPPRIEEPELPPIEAVESEVAELEVIEPEPVARLPEPEIKIVEAVDEPEEELSAPIEVIEPTEPTAESALESAADQLSIDTASDAPSVPADAMTDTSFDRAVREFVGDELGEIVEPAPEAVEPAIEPEPAVEEPPQIAAEVEAPSEPVVEPVAAIPDLPVAPPIDLEPPPVPVGEEFAVPDLKMPDVQFPPLAEPKKQEPALAEPASEILKVPPPPPLRSPIPGAPSGPRIIQGPMVSGRIPWGANQENFLGGVPLNLKNKGAGEPQQQPPPRSPMSRTPIGDRAVKDLIDKIDHVAAAAEAAASAPPPTDNDDLAPLIGSLPPRPRRGTFSSFATRPGSIESMPPLEQDRPSRNEISTGFDGLAMSPLAQMDAFSQSSLPSDLGLLGGDIRLNDPEATAPTSKTERFAPRRPIPPVTTRLQAVPDVMPPPMPPAPPEQPPVASTPIAVEPPEPSPVVPPSVPVEPADEFVPPPPPPAELADVAPIPDSPQPVPVFAGETPDSNAVRKKYIRRVSVLVGLMMLLIVAAAYGIYNYVGVPSTVEGHMVYENVSTLNRRNLEQFRENQLRLLKEESTQQSAKRLVPGENRGFLEKRNDYFAVADAAKFADDKPDTLVVHVESQNGTADRVRVGSMLDAMYEANQWLISEASRAKIGYQDVLRRIENDQKEVKRISDEIERLRRLDDARPDNQQIERLEGEFAALDTTWKQARTVLNDAKAALEKLTAAPATRSADVADDDLLKTMQLQLVALQAKLTSSRTASAQKADAARKSLDSSFETFQKQIADAHAATQGNPEAAAYVQAAQDFQEKTRQLTDDLMRRQEQQFARLMEYREWLNEQIEQRRAQQWGSDPRLQELNERLAMLTRQYNAAVGSGLQAEANAKKAEVESTKSLVKARQESLPVDTAFGETSLNKVQEIIESTRRDVAEDRRKTDQLLTLLQQGFTSSQTSQKLPAEQQQMAEKMRQQVAQINQARQAYNQAIDSADADADTELRSQIGSLSASIEARRKLLGQQQADRRGGATASAIEAKQQEILGFAQAEKTALEAMSAKNTELNNTKAAIENSKKNAEILDAMIRQKDVEDRNLKTDLAEVENRKRQADEAVEPIKPDRQRDISIVNGEDRRLLYISIVGGSILAIFFMMILWTLHTAHLEQPYAMVDEMEAPPLMGIDVQQARPGEADRTGAADDDTDEEHEPATI